MSSQTPAKLAYMAAQIARNLTHEPDPAAATAQHIHAFWTPGMIAVLRQTDTAGLPPVVRSALTRLPQT